MLVSFKGFKPIIALLITFLTTQMLWIGLEGVLLYKIQMKLKFSSDKISEQDDQNSTSAASMREKQNSMSRLYLQTQNLEEDDDGLSANKHVIKLLNALLVINLAVFSFPIRLLGFKTLVQVITGEISTNPLQLALVIVTIVLDLFINIVTGVCLQSNLPADKCCTARISNLDIYLDQFILYSFSLSQAFTHQSKVAAWLNGAVSVIVLLCMLQVSSYFNQKISFMKGFIHSAILSSSIILCVCFASDTVSRHQLIVFFVFITIFSNQLKFYYSKYLIRKGFNKCFKLSSANEAQHWLHSFEVAMRVNPKNKQADIIQLITLLKVYIKHHRDICTELDCTCRTKKTLKTLSHISELDKYSQRNLNRLKLLFIQMVLFKFINKNSEESSSFQKSNNFLGIYTIYQELQTNGNPYQVIYNLQKFHDCRNCSLIPCFQQFIVRKLAQDYMVRGQDQEKNQIKYREIIIYEVFLKGYLDVLSRITSEVSIFWRQVAKFECDFVSSADVSDRILDLYQKFKSMYDNINRQAGEHIQIETLALRLHQEVLNFENEQLTNFEKVKSCLNKRRLDMKLGSQSEHLDSKMHLIVMSGNPHNFESIVNISKSFAKFSGYTEEFLLKSKIHQLLPKVLASNHTSLVKRYLKKGEVGKRTETAKVMSWLKRPNSAVIPVQITVIPRIDVESGLQLIGLLQRMKKFHLFEQSLFSNQVFCIMTDINNKLCHMSENCVKFLQIPIELVNSDIFIYQILLNLPEILQNDSEIESILDFEEILKQSQFYYSSSDSIFAHCQRFRVMIHYAEHKFQGDNVLKIFRFIITGAINSLSPEHNSSLSSNHATQTNILALLQIMEEQDQRVDQDDQEQLIEDNSEIDEFQIQSMSSTSSGSSNVSTQDAQISDIKTSFEFSALPSSLKTYRIKVGVSFILLIITAMVLLIVNIVTKNQYSADLEALHTEKQMRNSFSSSKLSVLYLFASYNYQTKYFNQSNLLSPLNTFDLGPLFRTNLNDSLTLLHSSLVNFGQKQSLWDSDFVYAVSGKPITVIKITPHGNIQYVNSTFYKSITVYGDYADYIINTAPVNLTTKQDIFQFNEVKEVSGWIKNTTNPTLSYVIQYVFFCVYDGSVQLLNSILEVDELFISLIRSHGDKLINIILIFTICCCCVISISALLLVPYLFQIISVQLFTLNFVHFTSKSTIQTYLSNFSNFRKYLLNHNQSLDDVGTSENEKEGSKKINKVAIRQNFNDFLASSMNRTLGLANQNIGSQKINTGNREMSLIKRVNMELGNQQYLEEEKICLDQRMVRSRPNNLRDQIGTQQTSHTGAQQTTSNNILEMTKDESAFIHLADGNVPQALNLRKKQNIVHQGIHPPVQSIRKTLNQSRQRKITSSQSIEKQEIDDDEEEKQANESVSKERLKNRKGIKESKRRNGTIDDEKGQSLHSLSGTQEEEVGDGEKQMHEQLTMNLQRQASKSKIIFSIIFFGIASIVSIFYILTYVMSRNTLNTFKNGFNQYDIFFTRTTCVTESLFFIQKTIMYNESMFENTTNGQQLSKIINQCQRNEVNYRQVKKDGGGMFQSLASDLDQLDSDQFCQYLSLQGVYDATCSAVANGFLNLGLEQIITSIMNHVTQRRIYFEATAEAQKTSSFLNFAFFDQTMFEYVLIYYSYLDWVLSFIQDKAHLALSNQMSTNFNAIVSVFAVYLSVISLLSVLVTLRITSVLQRRLLRIRLLLKLMPSLEIYKHKEKLEKLNTKIL